MNSQQSFTVIKFATDPIIEKILTEILNLNKTEYELSTKIIDKDKNTCPDMNGC